jgi:tetratricopeptide (TPR) repeat protein
MDKKSKRKIKIVLIVFGILIIPIGYLIAILYSINMHDDAIKRAQMEYPNDLEITKNSIETINKAIKIYPWNYLFWINKAQLQTKLEDYRAALNSAQRATDLNNDYAEGLEYKGLIYEFLNQPDSAEIYYQKAIDKYKERFKRENDNLLLNREIALLYTFIGKTTKANDFLTPIPDTLNYYRKNMIHRYDYYIENYKSGGLKNFLHGETVKMRHDSITDKNALDSLIEANRIYTNETNTKKIESGKAETIYIFKEIFKDKAKTIGFREIEK